MRATQFGQRMANTRAGRAVQRNAAKVWNYAKNDWKGFTQKADRLPSRISNDATRVFNSTKDIFGKASNKGDFTRSLKVILKS